MKFVALCIILLHFTIPLLGIILTRSEYKHGHISRRERTLFLVLYVGLLLYPFLLTHL